MVSNKEIARAFRDCLQTLARTGAETRRMDKNEYICHALGDVTTACFDAKQAARAIVEERLGKRRRNTMACIPPGIHTVYTYLSTVVGVPKEQLTDTQVQRYRRRWVNALAKEFQTKG